MSKPDRAPRFAIEGSGHPGPDRAGRMSSQGSDGQPGDHTLFTASAVDEGRRGPDPQGRGFGPTLDDRKVTGPATLERQSINPLRRRKGHGPSGTDLGRNRRHGTRKGVARQRKHPERVLVTAEAHSGFSAPRPLSLLRLVLAPSRHERRSRLLPRCCAAGDGRRRRRQAQGPRRWQPCLLSAVCSLLSAVCCLLSAVCCLPGGPGPTPLHVPTHRLD